MAFYNTISDASNFVISFTSNPQQDFTIFAKGYAQAAAILATYLLEEQPRFSDYEAYPIVFLYRHAFELYLKGFCYRAILILAFKGQTLTSPRRSFTNISCYHWQRLFKKFVRCFALLIKRCYKLLKRLYSLRWSLRR